MSVPYARGISPWALMVSCPETALIPPEGHMLCVACASESDNTIAVKSNPVFAIVIISLWKGWLQYK